MTGIYPTIRDLLDNAVVRNVRDIIEGRLRRLRVSGCVWDADPPMHVAWPLRFEGARVFVEASLDEASRRRAPADRWFVRATYDLRIRLETPSPNVSQFGYVERGNVGAHLLHHLED